MNITAGPTARPASAQPVIDPLFMVPQPGQAAPQRARKQVSETVTLPRSMYRLLIAGAIAGAATLALGFLVALGCAVAKPANAQPVPASTQQTVVRDGKVTDFNDGFSDSKKDDCQQGFKIACDWLNK